MLLQLEGVLGGFFIQELYRVFSRNNLIFDFEMIIFVPPVYYIEK